MKRTLKLMLTGVLAVLVGPVFFENERNILPLARAKSSTSSQILETRITHLRHAISAPSSKAALTHTLSWVGVDQRRRSPTENFTSVLATFEVPNFDYNFPANTPDGKYYQSMWVGIDDGPGVMQCGVYATVERIGGKNHVDSGAWYERYTHGHVRIDDNGFTFKPGKLSYLMFLSDRDQLF
jgi:hypothetical protein